MIKKISISLMILLMFGVNSLSVNMYSVNEKIIEKIEDTPTIVFTYAYDSYNVGSKSGFLKSQGHLAYSDPGSGGVNEYRLNLGSIYKEEGNKQKIYYYIWVKAKVQTFTYLNNRLFYTSYPYDIACPENLLDLSMDFEYISYSGTITKTITYILDSSGSETTYGMQYNLTNTRRNVIFSIYDTNIVESNYRQLGYIKTFDSSNSLGFNHIITAKVNIMNSYVEEWKNGAVISGSKASGYYSIMKINSIEFKVNVKYQYKDLFWWNNALNENLIIGHSFILPDRIIKLTEITSMLLQ